MAGGGLKTLNCCVICCVDVLQCAERWQSWQCRAVIGAIMNRSSCSSASNGVNYPEIVFHEFFKISIQFGIKTVLVDEKPDLKQEIKYSDKSALQSVTTF